MNQSTLEGTVQHLRQISVAGSQGSLSSAASFISQVFDTLTAEGFAWQEPTVETGNEGVIVFLWQQGQRFLSLIIVSAETGRWFYEPGKDYGDVTNLDFTSRLTGGDLGPEEFAREVWPSWIRGEDPTSV